LTKISINSFNCEFGYELLSVLPYSYHLYKNNQLESTTSAYDTNCLYFFSPNHTEINQKRSWNSVEKLKSINFPNIDIHKKNLDWSKFSPPPLKQYYSDKKITFEKETIVIFNRYNNEWGKKPINFLDLPTLDKLFTSLKKDYQIVYLNLNHDERYFDHLPPIKFNDQEVLKNHPEILTFKELQQKYNQYTINELQLRIFAGCEKYISSNGGQLILSAYFGGENIIFSKESREHDPNVNSFYRWYDKLGNGTFHQVNNYTDLLKIVEDKWVQKKPMINILIRTSGRPNYFKECIQSIYEQTFKNWNIIVGIDNKESESYVQPEKCKLVYYDFSKYILPKKPNNNEYGVPFIYNLYINELYKYVKNGYCLILDDDNKLSGKDSLEIISNNIKTDDDLLFWKVKFHNRNVPNNQNFGRPPVLLDIDSAGFLFPISKKVDWEPFKRGDYRTANTLYNKVKNKIYIDSVLTQTQRKNEAGFGLKDDKTQYDLSIIVPTYNNIEYIDETINTILNSGKNYNIEILVGIDGCVNTLDYIKTKQYPNIVKFYYFYSNDGPYSIKNTLSKISSSEILIFFDSDDLMTDSTITETYNNLGIYDVVRFKHQEIIDGKIKPENQSFHEGSFAIKKQLFLSMNGFEPWKCAADSDFMSRLYKKRTRMFFTKNISVYYRRHSNSLTHRGDTGMSSKLRRNYFMMSKRKSGDGNPNILNVREFEHISINSFEQQKEIDYQKQIRDDKLNKIFNRPTRKQVEVSPQKKPDPVILDRLDFLYNNKPEPVRIIKTNKPSDRQELINKKNGTTKSTIKEMFSIKPNHREGKNFINFGGKFKK
jgi:glycosyltransferase involved in cell wall biosynthesis